MFWAKKHENEREGRTHIAYTETPDSKEFLQKMTHVHAHHFAFAYLHKLDKMFRWVDENETMPNEKVFEYHPEEKYGGMANKAVSSRYEPKSPYHGTPIFNQ